MVGPFFYIDSNELNYHGWVFHLTGEDSAEKYGDFMNSKIGHDELFDTKFRDQKTDIEYFEFPRGRVVYNLINDLHIIYIDKCLLNKVDTIVMKYNIKNYKVMEDEHYVCPKCMGDICWS